MDSDMPRPCEVGVGEIVWGGMSDQQTRREMSSRTGQEWGCFAVAPTELTGVGARSRLAALRVYL